jgi:hypothetical protein
MKYILPATINRRDIQQSNWNIAGMDAPDLMVDYNKILNLLMGNRSSCSIYLFLSYHRYL